MVNCLNSIEGSYRPEQRSFAVWVPVTLGVIGLYFRR